MTTLCVGGGVKVSLATPQTNRGPHIHVARAGEVGKLGVSLVRRNDALDPRGAARGDELGGHGGRHINTLLEAVERLRALPGPQQRNPAAARIVALTAAKRMTNCSARSQHNKKPHARAALVLLGRLARQVGAIKDHNWNHPVVVQQGHAAHAVRHKAVFL